MQEKLQRRPGKLSDVIVGQIRFDLFSKQESICNVADKFGVSADSVQRINACQTHKHSFTRFINQQPVTCLITSVCTEREFQIWLHRKAVRLHTTANAVLRLISRSGGNCEQCNLELLLGPQHKITRNTLCVDHVHANGKLRFVLCNSCNRRLGRLESDYNQKFLAMLADFSKI